ncbi:MAG: hypothetical protein BroJett007_31150 [Chloroflexota bacterium]|jgi:hypothetical protein|nr:MAG: hypothetical protein BroJett007_31150 [Chloroflexota bacterium]
MLSDNTPYMWAKGRWLLDTVVTPANAVTNLSLQILDPHVELAVLAFFTITTLEPDAFVKDIRRKLRWAFQENTHHSTLTTKLPKSRDQCAADSL